MPVVEIDRHLDPLPAFGSDLLGLHRQLLGRKPIEQCHILQPAASVILEQIAQDHAAGSFVGLDAHELAPGGRRPAQRSR